MEGLERTDISSRDPGLSNAKATKEERQFYKQQSAKPYKEFVKEFSGYNYGYRQGEAILDAHEKNGLFGTQSVLSRGTKGDIVGYYAYASAGRTILKAENAELTTAQTGRQALTATGSSEPAVANAEAIKPLKVDTYGNATKANKGSGNSADHIPSFASVVVAAKNKL